jgi:tetraacyldisaccharide 4'-kinase
VPARASSLSRRLSERLVGALQLAWWTTPANRVAHSLRPLAALYAAVASLHRGLTRAQRIGIPVVVVGNLIVGGAGKTPTTIAVLRLLGAFGWQPGAVSRGHGRRSSEVIDVQRDSRAVDCGDEPLLIHLRTGMPVAVGADRVAAARTLLAAHPAVNIIVADDGLQHHRLARDLQIIVFDDRGVGNGLLLPAGPLRQVMRPSPPANSLVLYNAAHVSTPWAGWMADRRQPGVLPLADWWQGHSPAADSWSRLQGRPLLAAAGMAAPERFFEMLRDQGLDLAATRALPDHYPYDELPWREGTPDVVVTEKDAVKLPLDRAPQREGTTRIWVVPLDLVPEVPFAAALKRHFPHPPKS